MTAREWTDGEEVALKFMWRVAGMSAPQIGAILKRSRNSIIGKVGRLGMHDQGRWTQGGQPRWEPFQNPRYRPEDDPSLKASCQEYKLPLAAILRLPQVSPRA